VAEAGGAGASAEAFKRRSNGALEPLAADSPLSASEAAPSTALPHLALPVQALPQLVLSELPGVADAPLQASPTETPEAPAAASSSASMDASEPQRQSAALRPASAPGAGGGAKAAPATAFSGPTRATRMDLDAHTLPVSPLFPLHMSLTLDEFEDVLAEAIFAGANKQSRKEGGAATATERHPKEEARVRFAAAVAKARAGAVAFYTPSS
jgi:hypothetical protein